MRSHILTVLISMAYWVTKFELAFAHYRQQRIDDEMTYGSVFDIEELIMRKSNISVEISALRSDIAKFEFALVGGSKDA